MHKNLIKEFCKKIIRLLVISCYYNIISFDKKKFFNSNSAIYLSIYLSDLEHSPLLWLIGKTSSSPDAVKPGCFSSNNQAAFKATINLVTISLFFQYIIPTGIGFRVLKNCIILQQGTHFFLILRISAFWYDKHGNTSWDLEVHLREKQLTILHSTSLSVEKVLSAL